MISTSLEPIIFMVVFYWDLFSRTSYTEGKPKYCSRSSLPKYLRFTYSTWVLSGKKKLLNLRPTCYVSRDYLDQKSISGLFISLSLCDIVLRLGHPDIAKFMWSIVTNMLVAFFLRAIYFRSLDILEWSVIQLKTESIILNGLLSKLRKFI